MIEWAVDGLDEVLVLAFKLKDFPGAIKPVLDIWGRKMLLYRIAGMINYPPPPPASRYQRTGKLGANWSTVDQGSTSFAFTNPTTYAHWVVGDGDGKNQAGHMGHWWIARERILEGLPGLEGEVKKEAESWYKN